MANSRVQLLSRDVLHITSVRREDKGMYQCYAYNDVDGAQGTAQIKIGGKEKMFYKTLLHLLPHLHITAVC